MREAPTRWNPTMRTAGSGGVIKQMVASVGGDASLLDQVFTCLISDQNTCGRFELGYKGHLCQQFPYRSQRILFQSIKISSAGEDYVLRKIRRRITANTVPAGTIYSAYVNIPGRGYVTWLSGWASRDTFALQISHLNGSYSYATFELTTAKPTAHFRAGFNTPENKFTDRRRQSANFHGQLRLQYQLQMAGGIPLAIRFRRLECSRIRCTGCAGQLQRYHPSRRSSNWGEQTWAGAITAQTLVVLSLANNITSR